MTRHLSKSRFLAGWQCHLQLYWRVHEPRAAELTPSPSLQTVFDIGRRVGKRAQAEFPGAVRIDVDPRDVREAVAATRRALDENASAILEASFVEDHVFVAVDVLTKEGDAYVLTEVKANVRPKPQHIPDLAIQAHVVERAGLPLARVEIMHLNPHHRHPDQGPLFVRTDVTAEVAELRSRVEAEIEAQLRMLQGPRPPHVEPGDHCNNPHLCPFHERCHVLLPDHAIEELNGAHQNLLDALREAGIDTIHDIPSDFPLKPLHHRHRAAVQNDDIVVEPGLREALDAYAFPIAMLDFETIGPALPVWNGCAPFEPIPVQFSVHTLHEDGRVTHSGYLADSTANAPPDLAAMPGPDPRPAVAATLSDALRDAETILAWNASFERRCLDTLAEASPEHADALRHARDKVHDLLPVVRNHLYHPGFRGSFSLKAVAPALLPHLRYDELEVGDGRAASSQLERLLCRPHELAPDEHDRLRQALETYCTRDTEVMVALFRLLVSLTR